MEDLIILTSVINTSPETLSYSIRSVFPPQKRLEQTAYSILSIRKCHPKYFLVFVEGSKIPIEWENFIKSKVDYYLNVADTDYAQYINSKSKGLGEASLLLSYLESDHFKENKNNIKNITKMTGRYQYNSNHIIHSRLLCIMPNYILAQKRENNTQISTITFTFPIKYVEEFIEVLKKSFDNEKFKNGSYYIESYLYDNWIKNKEHVYSPFTLGIEGLGATCGCLIKY